MTTVGVLLGAVALAGWLIRLIPWSINPPMAVTAFAPYLMVAGPFGLLALLLARHWIVASVVGLILVLGVSSQIRLYVGRTPPAVGVPIAMATLNLRLGQADPDQVVALIREHHVQLLAVQELTPQETDRLRRAGLDELLPYSALRPDDDAHGVGLWSSFRLIPQQAPTGFTFQIVIASAQVAGLAHPITVVSTHMAGPWPGPPRAWNSDLERMADLVGSLTAGGGSSGLLIGGDFNATPDHRQFRGVLGRGVADAADQAGAGVTPTYPADAWWPPLVAIDHVLTRNAVATRVRTVTVAGSDHRALLASVTVAAS